MPAIFWHSGEPEHRSSAWERPLCCAANTVSWTFLLLSRAPVARIRTCCTRRPADRTGLVEGLRRCGEAVQVRPSRLSHPSIARAGCRRRPPNVGRHAHAGGATPRLPILRRATGLVTMELERRRGASRARGSTWGHPRPGTAQPGTTTVNTQPPLERGPMRSVVRDLHSVASPRRGPNRSGMIDVSAISSARRAGWMALKHNSSDT